MTGNGAKLEKTRHPNSEKWMQIRSGFSLSLLICLAVLTTTLSVLVIVNHIHFARALSNSMTPEFQRGDVLLLKAVDRNQLSKGAIALLPMVQNPGANYTHRLIGIKNQDGEVIVKTKGDANPVADPFELKITSQEVPVVIGSIPAGAIPFFKNRNQIVFVLAILLLLVFISMFLPRKQPKQSRAHYSSFGDIQIEFVQQNEFQNQENNISTGEKQ